MLALNQDKDAWGNRPVDFCLCYFSLCEDQTSGLSPLSLGSRNDSSCLSRQGAKFTRPVGELTTCTNVLNVTWSSDGNYSALHIPWADIWWYCEKRDLCDILLSNSTGTCALVQLAILFSLAFHQLLMAQSQRHSKN
jgi:hypothetical protein